MQPRPKPRTYGRKGYELGLELSRAARQENETEVVAVRSILSKLFANLLHVTVFQWCGRRISSGSIGTAVAPT